MRINYNGNVPKTIQLKSGYSLYLYPKQKNIEISEQDWFLTTKLSLLRDAHPHLFTVLSEDGEATDKPSNVKQSSAGDFDLKDEKFKPKTDPTKQKSSVMGTLAKGEESLMLPGEKARKIRKKHTKVKIDVE